MEPIVIEVSVVVVTTSELIWIIDLALSLGVGFVGLREAILI